MISFSCLSPCKLNLFLYITGRRPDGYHDLQTLFCLLDYGDTMHFNVDGDNKIKLLTDFGFPQEDNLIYKAAKMLKEYSKTNKGCSILIDKILPQGGGLGGGSSNAATTLLVLNKLWGTNLSEDELASLGKQLGADVPVFIRGKSAFAEGVGEKLSPLELPKRYYLVYTPDCHVSTKAVFGDPNLKRDSKKRSLNELLSQPFNNDFTPTVRKNYYEVGHALDRLVKYGPAFMSGSGSSCFVSFNEKADAVKALEDFDPQNGKSFIASSVNLSPVLTALNEFLN